MVHIDNIYYNIGLHYDTEILKKEIINHYKDKERIRLIFDLDGKKISFDAMRKVKKIFDEVGVDGLEETCIIVKEKFKRMLIQKFLKLIKTRRPVKFL